MTPEKKAFWQRRLDLLRLMHALLEMPPGTLWCVGSMEEGPFARLIVPQRGGTYTGGYAEAFADTPAKAVRAALDRPLNPMPTRRAGE